jgi:hypothetical protein
MQIKSEGGIKHANLPETNEKNIPLFSLFARSFSLISEYRVCYATKTGGKTRKEAAGEVFERFKASFAIIANDKELRSL